MNFLYLIQILWATGLNMVNKLGPVVFADYFSSAIIAGSILSAYSASRFFAVPFGYFTDKIGKKRAMFLSFVAMGIIAFLITLYKNPLYYTGLFFAVGIISNFYYAGVESMTSILFKKKTKALFSLEVAYQTGAALGPFIGGYLIYTTTGYNLNNAMYAWVVFSLISAVLVHFYLPDIKNNKPKSKKESFTILFKRLKERSFYFGAMVFAGAGITGLIEGMLAVSLGIYLTNILNFEFINTGKIIGGAAIISALMLFLIKSKVEDIKKETLLIIMLLLMGASSILMLFVNNLYVLIFVAGFLILGRAGGLNVCKSFITKYFDEEIRGTGMALVASVQNLSKFISPLIAGFLIDTYSSVMPFYIMSGLSLLGIGLVLISRK